MSKFKPDCTNGPRRIEFGEVLPFATGWRGMADGREKYQAYLCSREWAQKRQGVLDRCEGICERCDDGPVTAIHHLTYIRKYNESSEDLQGLCEDCHAYIHKKSDYDPVAKLECNMQVSRPLVDMFQSDDKFVSSIVSLCVCPLPACKSQHVHIEKVIHQEGDAKGNGGLIVISMYCENNHKWETCFEFTKGNTFAFSRNTEDNLP